jgi:hypothetical protein
MPAYGVVVDPGGVGVAVADGVTEELGDELGVGELVVGEADGDVVGVVVVDGEVDGERDGVAGAELPRAGPTRSGGCTAGWPVYSRARAAMATPSTATANIAWSIRPFTDRALRAIISPAPATLPADPQSWRFQEPGRKEPGAGKEVSRGGGEPGGVLVNFAREWRTLAAG